jgi:hypothetical protein
MTDTTNATVDDSGTSDDATATGGTDDSATGGTESATGSDGTTGADCRPTGDPCGDCIADSCCDDLQACQADADCACVLECIASMMGDAAACTGMCKLQDVPQGLQDLAACTAGMCGMFCN